MGKYSMNASGDGIEKQWSNWYDGDHVSDYGDRLRGELPTVEQWDLIQFWSAEVHLMA